MDNFLRSSSSSSSRMSKPASSRYGRDGGRCRSAQKENETIETRRRHRSSLERSSVVPGASGEGKHEGTATESGDWGGGARRKRGREGGNAANTAGALVAKSNEILEDNTRRRNGAPSDGTVKDSHAGRPRRSWLDPRSDRHRSVRIERKDAPAEAHQQHQVKKKVQRYR